ncbi:MAG: hypothetical protein M1835_006960, partial [Candelina submexicana]
MIKIFIYEAINFTWTDAGIFVMFVPYNRDIMGTDGNIIHNFNSDYCKNNLDRKELVGKVINCDAVGDMAALLNAANGGSSGVLSTPQGYDTPFNVLSDSVFSVMGGIEGSVASWRKDPYKDAFDRANLSDDQVQEIAKMTFEKKTPGLFNIPVCQTLDLRFCPYAKLANGSKSCTACGAAVGGKPGSENKFWDAANDIVKTLRKGKEDY